MLLPQTGLSLTGLFGQSLQHRLDGQSSCRKGCFAMQIWHWNLGTFLIRPIRLIPDADARVWSPWQGCRRPRPISRQGSTNQYDHLFRLLNQQTSPGACWFCREVHSGRLLAAEQRTHGPQCLTSRHTICSTRPGAERGRKGSRRLFGDGGLLRRRKASTSQKASILPAIHASHVRRYTGCIRGWTA